MKTILVDAWNAEPRNDGPSLFKLMCFGFKHGPPHMKKHFMCQGVCFIIFFVVYLYWNGGLIPWFLFSQQQAAALTSTQAKLSVDILRHFPETEYDGTRVTWSHGTNSKKAMQEALAGSAMMIEGDIALRGMNTPKRQMVAVMAQPPASDGDITFNEWLDAIKDSRKGIKLDFMHIEAVELALQKMKLVQKEIEAPVHISAAVLNGPNPSGAGAYRPVDGFRFIRLVKSHCPKATLVLGWVDAPTKFGSDFCYSWAMALEMQELVDFWKLRQPVSFSVRASLVKESLQQLLWLMEMSADSSLTILAPSDDEVHVQDLLYVRSKLPKHRVLYDLHATVQSELNQVEHVGIHVMKQFKHGGSVDTMDQVFDENTFRGVEWNVAEGDDNQKVYLGTESVVMQNALLVTKRHIEGKIVNIYGRIQFFKYDVDKVGDIAFEVYLQTGRRIRHDTVKGLNVRIGLSGDVSIHGDTTKTAERLNGTQSCLSFVISYELHKSVGVRTRRSDSCRHMPDKVNHNAESFVELDMPLADKELTGYYVAMRHNNIKSSVAVEHFRIESL